MTAATPAARLAVPPAASRAGPALDRVRVVVRPHEAELLAGGVVAQAGKFWLVREDRLDTPAVLVARKGTR